MQRGRTGKVKSLIPHQSANILQELKIAHDMVIGKVILFSVCVKQAVSELMLNANQVFPINSKRALLWITARNLQHIKN